jgi:hypothetical protein
MDHLIQIGGVGAPDEPFMEGWTVLSALAAVTSRIRLATLASSVAYRDPAHLAKIAAGVDQISRGRLGAGEGFRDVAATPAEASDLIGRYAASGVKLFIASAWRTDAETLELLASEVMPQHA